MNLKYRIAFKLRPYGKTKTAYQIQLHVTFYSLRLITSTGCQIEDLSAWDEESQLVKPSYKGPRGETALKINNTLRNCREQMESTFKFFEGNDIIPTKKQVQERYEARLHGTILQRPDPEPKKERKPKAPDFFKTYDMFLKECGDKNAWTEATFEKMETVRVDLTTFIVNALSLGITPNVVMKWNGHSDDKAMKPYIDIVDSIKASSMTKFDGLI